MLARKGVLSRVNGAINTENEFGCAGGSSWEEAIQYHKNLHSFEETLSGIVSHHKTTIHRRHGKTGKYAQGVLNESQVDLIHTMLTQIHRRVWERFFGI